MKTIRSVFQHAVNAVQLMNPFR